MIMIKESVIKIVHSWPLYDESVAICSILLNLLNSAAKCRETGHTVIASKEGSSMFLKFLNLGVEYVFKVRGILVIK